MTGGGRAPMVRRHFLRAAALLAAAKPTRAADAPASAPRLNAWKIIGPGGGGHMMAPQVSPHDRDLVVMRSDMMPAYITRDGGRTWRMFHLGSGVRFFAFDPSSPKVIYAQAAGLFRSEDAGRSWRLVYPDAASLTAVAMAGDNAAPTLHTREGPAARLTALAVDPANPKLLYAGMDDRVCLSPDAGRTWRTLTKLRQPATGIYADAHALYVVAGNAVTVREGGRWTEHPPAGDFESFDEVSAGFSGGSLLLYGVTPSSVYVSRDGGRTWRVSTTMALSDPDVHYPDPRRRPDGFFGIAACGDRPEVAYVAYAGKEYRGVARTGDAGQTWQYPWKEARKGPPLLRDAWLGDRFPQWSGQPVELGAAPGDPDVCYGTGRGRVIRTADGGKTWDALYSKKLAGGYTTTGADITTCYGVHFDPFDARRVFISYTDIGLFRSEDGGATWLSSIAGIPRLWENTTYWVEFDPAVKGRMWAAMSHVHDLPRAKMWRTRKPLSPDDPVPWTSQYDGGVALSEDGGRTWKVSNSGMPPAAVTHILLDPTSPANARVLYAAAFGRGVFKSSDGGRTWRLRNNGIPGREPFAWRLVRDARGALYLIVARRSEDGSFGNAFDGALYRSADGAASWQRIQLPRGVNGPNGLAADPADPRRLYLAAWGRREERRAVDGGVFLSEDAGRTWRCVLPNDQHVYDVTIDPRDPAVIYAAGFESSAWRSTDRGAHWTRLGGFNFKWGHRVIPDPQDRTKVYITTFGGSVWHGPAAGDPNAHEDVSGRNLQLRP